MTEGPDPARSFPRRYAATQRFTLGAPRFFAISTDGTRVVFVRSRAGDDPIGCLWVLDLPGGEERLVCDPRDLDGADGDLPAEEQARRERARESAGGIVTYATDREVTRAVFSLGASAYVADLIDGAVAPLPVAPPVIAPRLDPAGRRVAFVRDRALWVVQADGSGERRLAGDDDPAVTWGLPDFVAAEEMGRMRGSWWSPDGAQIVAARVDESPVQRWHIGDPIDPAAEPAVHRYPAAGTDNADVTLHLITLEGDVRQIEWDRSAMPYLVDVSWRRDEPLTVLVQSRDQRRIEILSVAPDGSTTVVRDHENDPWIELIGGFPRWATDGRIIVPRDEPTVRRIAVAGIPVTGDDLQVRRLVGVSDGRMTFTASSRDDPTSVQVYSCELEGSGLQVHSTMDGVSDAVARGNVMVVVERSMSWPGSATAVHHPGGIQSVRSFAETPDLPVNATPLVLGERKLRAMLLLPNGYEEGSGPLPVLLDPYGGPHAQRVLRSHNAHLQSQWFADAGFAVLVVDGRGSPGRGPTWEQAVAGDLATAPLEDQTDALLACAAQHPGLLDLDRVAIKGWSFGGYLAALAVLRRPDVFHAAIAGAPVTDWRLYDTHYTERYLGNPTTSPEVYEQSSLLADAPSLQRPLLLIHGLSDDNVVAAHTLRLSRALLEAGRPHTVLPLAGVTHMTPQEVVAENLLHLQLQFLRTSLRVGASSFE